MQIRNRDSKQSTFGAPLNKQAHKPNCNRKIYVSRVGTTRERVPAASHLSSLSFSRRPLPSLFTGACSHVPPHALPHMYHGIRPISVITEILDFRGFYSSRISILRGRIPRPIGNVLELLNQTILIGIILVGRLGVRLRNLPQALQDAGAFDMRNLLGWLRLGWLKTHNLST